MPPLAEDVSKICAVLRSVLSSNNLCFLSLFLFWSAYFLNLLNFINLNVTNFFADLKNINFNF